MEMKYQEFQVKHAYKTEQVIELRQLLREQILVAAGVPISWKINLPKLSLHMNVGYAEDPYNGFKDLLLEKSTTLHTPGVQRN